MCFTTEVWKKRCFPFKKALYCSPSPPSAMLKIRRNIRSYFPTLYGVGARLGRWSCIRVWRELKSAKSANLSIVVVLGKSNMFQISILMQPLKCAVHIFFYFQKWHHYGTPWSQQGVCTEIVRLWNKSWGITRNTLWLRIAIDIYEPCLKDLDRVLSGTLLGGGGRGG